MNKNFIINNIELKVCDEGFRNKEELLEVINQAIGELEAIRNYFDNVQDPKLVEVAIYTEAAVKAKYDYLIKEAKRLGLNCSIIAS